MSDQDAEYERMTEAEQRAARWAVLGCPSCVRAVTGSPPEIQWPRLVGEHAAHTDGPVEGKSNIGESAP